MTFDLGISSNQPDTSTFEVVKKVIESAKVSILVACYEFTSKEIADCLIEAKNRDISVQVVADKTSSQMHYSVIPQIKASGIPVRLNSKYHIHHHKFMVIDDSTVETGSFNYTPNAIQHNAENALALWDCSDIATAYKKAWQFSWDESEEMQ